jgi:hypothetical protein
MTIKFIKFRRMLSFGIALVLASIGLALLLIGGTYALLLVALLVWSGVIDGEILRAASLRRSTRSLFMRQIAIGCALTVAATLVVIMYFDNRAILAYTQAISSWPVAKVVQAAITIGLSSAIFVIPSLVLRRRTARNKES